MTMDSENKMLTEKWKPLLESEKFAPIKDDYRKSVTARLIENTQKAMKEDPSFRGSGSLTEMTYAGTGGFTGSATASGPVAGSDPVLISLIRRAMPQLIAFDICGVQPMTGPTGLVFAMRARYDSQTGREAFFDEANTAHSGTGVHAGGTGGSRDANGAVVLDLTTGTGMPTAQGELLGTIPGTNDWRQMSVSFEKVTAEARTRKLKAEYSIEFAQDLKSVHGLDAESLLSSILSTEILSEINRELVRTIFMSAVPGATGTSVAGVYDLAVDADGRWLVERFKGLHYQIEREANAIAIATRRGRGNIILCSSNVASALMVAQNLDFTPALQNDLQVLNGSTTFAGTLNGRYRVYVDPYAINDYLVVGYRGESPLDAGLFYCPYTPLQFSRAIDPNSMQPVIGFQTRAAIVSNPFAGGSVASNGSVTANTNQYYRRIAITGL